MTVPMLLCLRNIFAKSFSLVLNILHLFPVTASYGIVAVFFLTYTQFLFVFFCCFLCVVCHFQYNVYMCIYSFNHVYKLKVVYPCAMHNQEQTNIYIKIKENKIAVSQQEKKRKKNIKTAPSILKCFSQ